MIVSRVSFSTQMFKFKTKKLLTYWLNLKGGEGFSELDLIELGLGQELNS